MIKNVNQQNKYCTTPPSQQTFLTYKPNLSELIGKLVVMYLNALKCLLTIFIETNLKSKRYTIQQYRRSS